MPNNSPGKTPLVLIHGSPGSSRTWRAFASDLALQKRFEMVVPDRMGYGKGELPELRLAAQAEKTQNLFTIPAVVVGFSFGGAVAARLAGDYPEKVKKLVLLASVADPGLERVRWRDFAGKLVGPLLPQAWRASLAESAALPEELAKLEWGKIRAPTTIMHGDADREVDFRNLGFLEKKLPKVEKKVVLPGLGHVLPSEAFEEIRGLLLDL